MSRIQGKTISDGTPVYAGVDVSKATLELHVLEAGGRAGGGQRHRFANDAAGIAALLGCLEGHCRGRPGRVAFEPTGRFHLGLWRGLDRAGHAAVPFNPYRARHFAEADGQPAKTDAIDARMLARAAASMDLRAAPPPAEEHLRIKELHGLRLGTVGMLRAAKNRRGAASDVIPVRSCPMCTAAYLRIETACPECGYSPVPAGRSTPEQVDGDLLELAGTQMQFVQAA